MRIRNIFPALAAFLGLLLLAQAGTAQAARTITVEGLDTLKFTKTHIVARPGEKLTITLVNNTKLPPQAMSHNLAVLSLKADPAQFANAALGHPDNGYIPPDMQNLLIADTGMVAGGESKSVTFTVPEKPGDYPYICTFPGHYAAGMKGTLTVKP